MNLIDTLQENQLPCPVTESYTHSIRKPLIVRSKMASRIRDEKAAHQQASAVPVFGGRSLVDYSTTLSKSLQACALSPSSGSKSGDDDDDETDVGMFSHPIVLKLPVPWCFESTNDFAVYGL
jgi:hypothetical protein